MASDPNEPWQHVHPISLAFVFYSKLRQFLIPAIFGVYSATQGRWIIVGIGLIALAALVALAIAKYLSLQYRIVDGELQVRDGIFFRSNRTVPTNRIQNVDLVQNLLHRVFGVAEVRIETASGKEPEAVLQVLTLSQVERLRASIFAERKPIDTPLAIAPALEQREPSAQTTSPQTASQSPAAPQLLLGITIKQLALAGLTSNRGLLLVPIAMGTIYELRSFTSFKFKFSDAEIKDWLASDRAMFAGGTLFWVGSLILVCIGLFLLLKLFSILWFVIRFYGYQLLASGDDLRISCGLFTKVSATIPRSRIQFISIHRSWLGRRVGLAAIRIETAGGSGSEHENASRSIGRRWFVPVISEPKIAAFVERLRPGIQWNEASFDWRPLSRKAGARLQRSGILISLLIGAIAALYWRPWGLLVGAMVLPWMLWRAHRKANSMRYARVGALVVFRSGLLTRKCSCTFIDKIQTIRLSDSPFDRRWKMATLAIDTAASGPAEHRIAVSYLDAQFAAEEFAALRLSTLGI